MEFMKRHAFKIAVLALCALMGIYLLSTMNLGGEPLKKMGPAPAYEMQDVEGNTVSLESTNGKVRLYYFYFSYCPDVCPPTTAQLAKVQEAMKKDGGFGDQFLIQQITIDPNRDTPERIKDYASKFEADFAGWKFLRGEEAATHALAKEYGVTVIKADEQTFSHTNYFILVDQQGEVRRYIKADEETDMDQVVKDIKRLIKEQE
ncbi:SCO family protein [Paenibacillus sp. SYP-B4298]|uniref:SCO family protein n=1 Tax=Paenibacillus sp. SYP-B4298 TaxID=2996034 RepID=UPI0022DD6902|nr:SCO family protein [Paenibacillus sp. SYP-B4298]